MQSQGGSKRPLAVVKLHDTFATRQQMTTAVKAMALSDGGRMVICDKGGSRQASYRCAGRITEGKEEVGCTFRVTACKKTRDGVDEFKVTSIKDHTNCSGKAAKRRPGAAVLQVVGSAIVDANPDISDKALAASLKSRVGHDPKQWTTNRVKNRALERNDVAMKEGFQALPPFLDELAKTSGGTITEHPKSDHSMSLPTVIVAMEGAGSDEGNADSGAMAAEMGQAGGDPSVTAAAFTGSPAAPAMAEDTQHNGSVGSKSAKRKYVQWSADMEYSLMAQVYEEQVHVVRHRQKGKRFKAVADKLNSLPDFENVGGVSQSKMEERYKRLMAAHREKVANGAFKSGEREGVLNSTQYLCDQMMEEEGGYLELESHTEQGESPKETPDEVIDLENTLAKYLESHTEQGGSPEGTLDDDIDLENTLAKYLESHTDDPETKRRKLKVKEDEAAAALMQATSFRDVAVGSLATRKHKEEVEMIEAHTRKLQEENQKMQLEQQAEQASQTAKLNAGLLAVLERMTPKK